MTPRKSRQFEFRQDLRFFKQLYLFYKKDLDEISKGENEYLGEKPKFSAAPQKKREGKGGILYFLQSVHPPEVKTLDNVHPPEVQTLQNDHFS